MCLTNAVRDSLDDGWMQMRVSYLGAAAILATLMAAGCGNPAASTPPTTDTYSGVVAAGGFDGRLFDVKNDGEVDITITALAPQSTIIMGLGIGQPSNDGLCTLFGNINNGVGGVLLTAVPKGTYCYLIYDLGNVTGSINYTLTITHP
jgi:hypothetical protein